MRANSNTRGIASVLLASAFTASIASAAAPNFVARSPGLADLDRLSLAPGSYRALSLDFAHMESELARATEKVPAQLILPSPDGSNLNFEVLPVEIMSPELAAQFPRARRGES